MKGRQHYIFFCPPPPLGKRDEKMMADTVIKLKLDREVSNQFNSQNKQAIHTAWPQPRKCSIVAGHEELIDSMLPGNRSETALFYVSR